MSKLLVARDEALTANNQVDARDGALERMRALVYCGVGLQGAPMNSLSQIAERMVDVQYSAVVAQALSPAILLTAISAFLTMVMNRLWRVLDQARRRAADRTDADPCKDASGIAVLHRRARLLYQAIYSCVGAALAVIAVVLLTFANRVAGALQDWGVAAVFIFAVCLFAAGFINLLREVRLAIAEFERSTAAEKS